MPSDFFMEIYNLNIKLIWKNEKNNQKNLEKKNNVDWGRAILTRFSTKILTFSKEKIKLMVTRSKYWLSMNKSYQIHFNFLLSLGT